MENVRKHTDEGRHEEVDSTPISRHVGFTRPPSIHETIQRLVRQELSARAAAQGHETFEEADDFDVGDDFEPNSPYELDEAQATLPLPVPEKPPVGPPGGPPAPSAPAPAPDKPPSEPAKP